MKKKIKADICVELIVLCCVLLVHFFAVETRAGSFYEEYPVETGEAASSDRHQEDKSQTEISEGTGGEQSSENAQGSQAEETASQPVMSLPEMVISYAEQFVGNPYVWGGTSLTDGADCSGFVQTVYGNFGVDLPRTSREQALVGRRLALEEAEPGDLIFYERDGEIYHVVIYTGEGQSVQAKSSEAGITWAPVDYEHAVWAVGIL